MTSRRGATVIKFEQQNLSIGGSSITFWSRDSDESFYLQL